VHEFCFFLQDVLVQLSDDSKYLADCEAGLNWKSDVDLMVLPFHKRIFEVIE